MLAALFKNQLQTMQCFGCLRKEKARKKTLNCESQAEISDIMRCELDFAWVLVKASLTFSGKND